MSSPYCYTHSSRSDRSIEWDDLPEISSRSETDPLWRAVACWGALAFTAATVWGCYSLLSWLF